MSAVSNILNFRLGNLFRSDSRYLAIDIGSSSVKMLEVESDSERLRVLSHGSRPLGPTAVLNNMVQDPGEVSAAIRALVDHSGARANLVVTAVPGPAVIIKKIALPSQSPRELDNAVLFEAGNFIPENLENVNLDYQIVDFLEKENQVEVLLVAVKKEIINSYTNAVRLAGLEPAVVDVDYFALENMFELNYPPASNDVVALVNIGARYSCINILRGNRSTFTGDVPIGGKEFNDTLTRSLGVSNAEAEAIKLVGSRQHSAEDIDSMLAPVKEFVVEEIHRALSFFWTAATDESISAVYVTGGGAQVPDLVPLLQQRLGVPVLLAQPFDKVEMSNDLRKALERDGASYGIAVGLGVRRRGDK